MIIILLAIVVSGFIFVFTPKEKSLNVKTFVNDSGITDKNFRKFVAENKGKRIYYFCSSHDANCAYVNNTVLKALAENLQVEVLEEIYYVDLSAAQPTATAKFKRQWGFAQYPAFSYIDSTVDPYVITSSIGFHNETPFNSDDIKKWLIDNGVWQLWQAQIKNPPAED